MRSNAAGDLAQGLRQGVGPQRLAQGSDLIVFVAAQTLVEIDESQDSQAGPGAAALASPAQGHAGLGRGVHQQEG